MPKRLPSPSTKEGIIARSTPEPNSGCWLWDGAISRKGYGTASFKGRHCTAHRASYQIFKEPIPKEMLACHKCDTRACVNPDHIFIGTPKDNTHDMMQKGRWAGKGTHPHKNKGYTRRRKNYWAVYKKKYLKRFPTKEQAHEYYVNYASSINMGSKITPRSLDTPAKRATDSER